MATTLADARYSPLVRALAHGLRRRCGVGEGDRLLVACSGGADSVALLRALHLLHDRRRWSLSLQVAHVHHHMRSAEQSDADAAFVQALAERLQLPYHRRDIHPARLPGNAEANARDQRYAALADIAKAAETPFVVTAHHADDQLETVLMAMLRGTSVKGLRGIAWRRSLCDGVSLIRPMLAGTHEQALQLLGHLDQPWREDHTNDDLTRTRARLRHEVLPVLRDIRPSVANKVVELTDRLRDDAHT